MESVRSAFHAQLATVMDSLLAAAVCEIAKIFEGSLCEQQAELAQKAEEISRLRCRLEKVERRHEAKGGCTDEGELLSGDGEGSLRQQTPIGSGLDNLQPDGTDGSATASGSIGNDSSCFQRGFGSDETSNEGDDTSFAFLDQESENQNSEQGAGEKEAQADLTPATSGETAWRTRDDRGGINHTRRIAQFATRDPLRQQSNSQLLAARQTNALSHPTASSGGNGRPYSCPYCTKCFTYPSHQRRHLLRHTGVRLHPCQFCDKSFLTPSELTVHTRTHTGERPFGCTQCGKRFARSGNLRAHQRDVHMGKRPFACVECGKRFAHRGNLRVHNHRVHQGDPYYTDGQPEPDINQNTV
ncbi:hypothetical protein XENOCAPTIV_008238 [Xenoophorus captivus]|uniref:C2H2-type domain-containing protein n=1 Tax=Xenoophorus captivus TaxID=1517983 RepID=A0ABV0QIB2_9TELE